MGGSWRAFHLRNGDEGEQRADVAAFGAVLKFEFPAPGDDVLAGVGFHDAGSDVGEGADPWTGADAAIDGQRRGAIGNFAVAGGEVKDGFWRILFEPGFGVGSEDIGAPAFAGVDGGGDVVGVAAEAGGAVDRAIKGRIADAEKGEEDGDVDEGFFEEEGGLVVRDL